MTGPPDHRPVFVVGAPRSGTTLVYSLLLASGEFAMYEEGETRLLQCRGRYGPLWFGPSYRRFMEDWIASDQFLRAGLPAEPFRREAERHRSSYVDFLRFFMSEMCRTQGRSRWAEKTPANVHHMERLARAFPTALFVHVVRDARDVALSRRKLGWHVVRSDDRDRQLLGAVKHWELLVRKGRRSGRRLGGRYLELRFEDLVEEPEPEISRLARFTDAAIPVRFDAGPKVGALKKGFSAFEDPIGGISSRPVGRWRKHLSDREREIVVAAGGSALEDLGYPTGEARPAVSLRWDVFWRGALYGVLLRLRHWLREHTLLGLLRRPRLLDFGGRPLPASGAD